MRMSIPHLPDNTPDTVAAPSESAQPKKEEHDSPRLLSDKVVTPRISFRRSSLHLGHTHRGFGQSKRSEPPQPQSTPVLVFGEVSAPHPSNCKHKGPGIPDKTQKENTETNKEEQSGVVSQASSADKNAGIQQPSVGTSHSTFSKDKPDPESIGDGIAALERINPIATPTAPASDILASHPPETPSSLGTRAILGTVEERSKMVGFWGKDTSKATPSVPAGVGDALPVQSPVGEVFTTDLPVPGLPSISPAPVQLDVPTVPTVDLGKGVSERPHAKKRVRRKIKTKVQPQVTKARKLLLKKKILSKILGKELTAIIEPHLNAATSGATDVVDNGASVPSAMSELR